eukprot:gene5377-9184_t
MKQFLIFFCLALFYGVNSQGCVLFRNTFITYEEVRWNGTKCFSVNYYTLNRNGWSGIGFSNKNNSKNINFFVVGYLPSNIVEFKNISKKATKPKILHTGWNTNWHFNFDNILSFSIVLPKTFFQKQKFVFFIENKQEENFKNLSSLETFKVLEFRRKTLLNDTKIECINHLAGIGKIETTNGFTFSIVVIFYLIIGILCGICFYFKLQPIYSRKFAPMIATVSQLTIVITYGLLNFTTDNEYRNFYGCYYEAYLIYPAVQTIYLIILLNYFRYLLIINSNRSKIQFFKNYEIITSSKLIKFTKKLSSPLLLFVITGIYVILFLLIMTLIFEFFNFQCSSLQHDIMNYIQMFSTMTLGFLLLFSQLYDFLRSIPKFIACKMSIWDFFIVKDPYLFRLEMISSFFLLTFYLSYSIYGLKGNIAMILNSIVYFWFFWISTLFSLFITVVQNLILKIRNYLSKEERNEVELIFENTSLFQLFQEFSKNEWTLEYLYIKKDLMKYSKIEDVPSLLFLSKNIYQKYLRDSVIDINSSMIKEVKIQIDQNTVDCDTFKKIEMMVDEVILDSFNRFKLSMKYQKFINKEGDFLIN